MSVDVRRESERAIVAPQGDIVASAVPRLRPILRDLARSGVREMVVDLSNTKMIDSTGVGLILSAFNTLRAAGGSLSIVNATDDLLGLFRILRMHQHFPISGKAAAQ